MARGHLMPSIPQYSGLLTDLYELTMAAGYLETGFDARATFELFVRSLPCPQKLSGCRRARSGAGFSGGRAFFGGGDRVFAHAAGFSGDRRQFF